MSCQSSLQVWWWAGGGVDTWNNKQTYSFYWHSQSHPHQWSTPASCHSYYLPAVSQHPLLLVSTCRTLASPPVSSATSFQPTVTFSTLTPTHLLLRPLPPLHTFCSTLSNWADKNRRMSTYTNAPLATSCTALTRALPHPRWPPQPQRVSLKVVTVGDGAADTRELKR